jgi:hypothetical protein
MKIGIIGTGNMGRAAGCAGRAEASSFDSDFNYDSGHFVDGELRDAGRTR